MAANQTPNYTALSRNYTSKQLYKQFMSHGGNALSKIAGLLILILVFAVFGLGFTSIATAVARESLSVETGRMVVFAIHVLALCVTASIVGLLIRLTARSMTESLRLKDFAAENNMTFMENSPPANQPGMMFQIGHSRYFSKALALPTPTGAIVGNYQYTTGSGKNRSTHTCGIIRVTLSRKLPHVLLDATSNNFLGRISNFGGFGSDQEIGLEGDFNKYFKVYAPTNYGRDMLYWLTPELMELLKLHFASYDIEVVDNYAYLYSRNKFALNEAGIKSMLNLSAWLHNEFEENTRRYSDERVGSFAANVVSEPGRRLKRKFQWWTLVFIVLYVILRIFIESKS